MFEMERKSFEAKLDGAKAALGVEEARLANARRSLAVGYVHWNAGTGLLD